MASGALGAGIWVATGSPVAFAFALTTGVFTDIDHSVDLFNPDDHGRQRYMLRPFHAWEYSIVALVVLLASWYHPVFLAAIVGHLSHLVIDQFTNRVHPLGYFIAFRASRGFRRRRLTPHLFEDSPSGPDPVE